MELLDNLVRVNQIKDQVIFLNQELKSQLKISNAISKK